MKSSFLHKSGLLMYEKHFRARRRGLLMFDLSFFTAEQACNHPSSTSACAEVLLGYQHRGRLIKGGLADINKGVRQKTEGIADTNKPLRRREKCFCDLNKPLRTFGVSGRVSGEEFFGRFVRSRRPIRPRDAPHKQAQRPINEPFKISMEHHE